MAIIIDNGKTLNVIYPGERTQITTNRSSVVIDTRESKNGGVITFIRPKDTPITLENKTYVANELVFTADGRAIFQTTPPFRQKPEN